MGGLGALGKQYFCHTRGQVLTVDFSIESAVLESTRKQDFRLMQPIFTILNSVRSESRPG
jgi:hypothetical protein